MDYGQRIRNERKRKDIKQGELAKFIGISQAALNKIEKGLTKQITLETAKKIAERLEVSFMDFFEVEDYVREQAEDRMVAKEYFMDGFIENIYEMQFRLMELLAKYANTLSIPVNTLLGYNDMPDSKKHIALLEYQWLLLKNSGIIDEPTLKRFVYGYMLKYEKLYFWFTDFRMSEEELKNYISKEDLKELDYFGTVVYFAIDERIDRSRRN